MTAKNWTIICILLGACAQHPPQEEDMWPIFQNRCLTPFFEERAFATEGLQPVSPSLINSEKSFTFPPSSDVRVFRSGPRGWKLLTVSQGSERLCAILSQRDHPSALQVATEWAAVAVENSGFTYDHHFGDHIKNGSADIMFGNKVQGWKTIFLVEGSP